jgi:hypothetical protein
MWEMVDEKSLIIPFRISSPSLSGRSGFILIILSYVRFQVLTAAIIRVITLMTDAVGISETSVYSDETTKHYIPEGPHPQS